MEVAVWNVEQLVCQPQMKLSYNILIIQSAIFFLQRRNAFKILCLSCWQITFLTTVLVAFNSLDRIIYNIYCWQCLTHFTQILQNFGKLCQKFSCAYFVLNTKNPHQTKCFIHNVQMNLEKIGIGILRYMHFWC